uniref:DH domain-containing protein n=1 Tax=Timema genevievae TaxID=629358 RepID=A0A7R9K3C9_TIMGE|nr:unnamed protein product [Timema genevievae]
MLALIAALAIYLSLSLISAILSKSEVVVKPCSRVGFIAPREPVPVTASWNEVCVASSCVLTWRHIVCLCTGSRLDIWSACDCAPVLTFGLRVTVLPSDILSACVRAPRRDARKPPPPCGGACTTNGCLPLLTPPRCVLPLDEARARAGSWDEGGGAAAVHRRLEASQRTVSSEESWYSGSDQELSSGDESERSAEANNRSNGQLKSTLHKARTLCDKWKGGKQPPEPPPGGDTGAPGRLSRWFSIRRGSVSHYDVDPGDRGNKMPLLPEVSGSISETLTFRRNTWRAVAASGEYEELLVEEESTAGFANFSSVLQRRQIPPSLPPPPHNITPQQLKRRHIVAAIVHSENSYVATLQRLVNVSRSRVKEIGHTQVQLPFSWPIKENKS